MKNDIYNYLHAYYENKINSTKNEISKTTKLFRNIERFESIGLITQEQKDLLIEDMCRAMDYVIKILSSCPALVVELRNIQKQTTIVKPYVPRNYQEVSAIGFQYEPDESADEDY